MSLNNLTTYLNDHIAGSVVALELLDHMISLEQGKPRQQVLTRLRSDIEADQKTLQGLLQGVGGTESRLRKAAAWLTEKLGRAKLSLDDPGTGALQVLEALEAIALGIQGKVALWRALAAASVRANQLDYAILEQQALKQFQTVETQRIEAARAALSL